MAAVLSTVYCDYYTKSYTSSNDGSRS